MNIPYDLWPIWCDYLEEQGYDTEYLRYVMTYPYFISHGNHNVDNLGIYIAILGNAPYQKGDGWHYDYIWYYQYEGCGFQEAGDGWAFVYSRRDYIYDED